MFQYLEGASLLAAAVVVCLVTLVANFAFPYVMANGYRQADARRMLSCLHFLAFSDKQKEYWQDKALSLAKVYCSRDNSKIEGASEVFFRELFAEFSYSLEAQQKATLIHNWKSVVCEQFSETTSKSILSALDKALRV